MWRRARLAVLLSLLGLLPARAAQPQAASGELIDPWQRAGAPPRQPLAPWSPQRTKTLDDELVDPWRTAASRSGQTAAVPELIDPWPGQTAPPSARFADVLIVDPWSVEKTKIPTAAFPPVDAAPTIPRSR